MAEDKEKFPYPICKENADGIRRVQEEIRILKSDVMNHLSDIKKNNGMTGAQKIALYTILIETVGAIILTIIKIVG